MQASSTDRKTLPLYLNPDTQASSHTMKLGVAGIKKRMFDVVVSIIVTVSVLIWLIPLLGLLIKLSSPGPVLFIQLRTGRFGRVFPCLKFRTMAHNDQSEFKQASRDDQRVTRLGKILRRTNLDEMPQFLNVLAGHMSIVGPRPHAIQHDAQYWNSLPGYKERYIVKPGITGLAQVRGARGETRETYKMKVRVQYDSLYIRRQSTRLDAKICLWTIKAAMNGNKNAW